MGIDELVEEGFSPKHAEAGEDLRSVMMEARIPLLLKHYRNSIPAEARAGFNKLSELDQIEALRKKNYVLPKEHADAFIRDMGLYVLRKHDPDMAKMFESSLNTFNDKASNKDQKAKAWRRMDLFFKPALMKVGFNWEALETQGAKFGFNERIFTEHAGSVGEGYVRSMQDSYIGQAKESEFNDYLKKIGKAEKGFKVDVATGENPGLKQQIVAQYVRYKKDKNVDGFRKAFHPYFK